MKLKHDNERIKALLLVTCAAVLWSMGGILIKSINAHPLAISGSRSAIAALVMLAYIRKPKFTFSFAQIGAAVGYSGTVFLFVAATKTTTAANAILLQFTSPIFVALLGSWILKEKAKAKDWLIIALVLSGMALFFLDKLSPKGMLGNVFAIMSGISFSLFAIFMRKQKNTSSGESVLLGNILTAVIGLPFLAGSHLAGGDWLFISISGVFQLGLSYVLFTMAIKHITALESILTSTIEPILNPVWVLIFMGEKPGRWALVGGTIVLGSIILRYFLVRPAKEIQASAEVPPGEAAITEKA